MTDEEAIAQVIGARIIAIDDGRTPPEFSQEFGSYEVAITTDRGTFRIIGAHDSRPDLLFEVNPNPVIIDELARQDYDGALVTYRAALEAFKKGDRKEYPAQLDGTRGCICRTCRLQPAMYLDQCEVCREKSSVNDDRYFSRDYPPT